MIPMAMAASAGFSFVQGLGGASKANIAGYNNMTQSYLNEAAQWEDNTAVNKALGEANLQNTIRNGYKVGLLNIQKSQAMRKALQDGTDLRKQKLQVIGAQSANAAAAGTIGASVEAVTNDIDMRVDDAAASQDYEQTVQNQNFDTMLHDLMQQGQDSLRTSVKARVQQGQSYSEIGPGEVLANTAVQVGSEWASAYMKLGLGTKKPQLVDSTQIPMQAGGGY